MVPLALGALGGLSGDWLANLPQSMAVAGYAALAWPPSGAKVRVYQLLSNGQPGALLASAVTDRNGHYAATVSRGGHDTLLVVTSGGSYVDEITKQTMTASVHDALRTVLSSAASYASLTPLTTMATARALVLAAHGDSVRDAVAVSYTAMARAYSLPSLADLYPTSADIPPEQQAQVSDFRSRQLGLVLAGLDQVAHNLGVSDFALTAALAQDASDGLLDGRADGRPVMIAPSIPLPDDAANRQLQRAMDGFAASPANQTHLPAPLIALQAPRIEPSGLLGFYVWTTALPAFVNGSPAVAPIQASGGAQPYSCALVGGSLPPHFGLSPDDCTVHYDGTPVLGPSRLRIGPALVIRASDSSAPPQTSPRRVRTECGLRSRPRSTAQSTQ